LRKTIILLDPLFVEQITAIVLRALEFETGLPIM